MEFYKDSFVPHSLYSLIFLYSEIR